MPDGPGWARMAAVAAGVLLLTGGASVVLIGVAAQAGAPRVEAPFVVSTARPPHDVTPPLLPPAALDRSVPVAISIPSINVRSTLGEVGLAPDGTIEVPAPGPSYDLAAWYRHSPTPGELGPAVIEGHLDRPDGSPSVFYRLGELVPGTDIEVTRADGKILTYRVSEVGRYLKAAFPTPAVYSDLDHPGLRLLTCGGPQDENGDYRENVVVFAELDAVTERVLSGTSERTGDTSA